MTNSRSNLGAMDDSAEMFAQLAIMEETRVKLGALAAYGRLKRFEVAHKLRKPSLGIYDHNLHLIGGGQKYGCMIAQALQDDFDITLISHRPITRSQLSKWYGLDLSRVAVQELPYAEELGSTIGSHIDPSALIASRGNSFQSVSRHSSKYDFFLNNGMNERVYPLTTDSYVMCHFPERRPNGYFYLDRYSQIIYNSHYTAEWIRARWNIEPDHLIYPPVNMEPEAPIDPINSSEQAPERQRLILSVARFERGGSKKQLEMIRAFYKLQRSFPGYMKGWKLVLAGGSHEGNEYLEAVRNLLSALESPDIEIRVDISVQELRELYGQAKIFWHLCGLDETDPALVEHFGMTVAESMQSGVVPIVFRGGGMTEIVTDGVSGFTVTNTAGLLRRTLSLIEQPGLLARLGGAARVNSQRFNVQRFNDEIQDYFRSRLAEYCKPDS